MDDASVDGKKAVQIRLFLELVVHGALHQSLLIVFTLCMPPQSLNIVLNAVYDG